MEPDKDVKILYAQDINGVLKRQRRQCRSRHHVRAYFDPCQSRRFALLVDVTTSRFHFYLPAYCRRRRVVRDKNDALTRFLRGYIEALALIRKDKESTRSLGKFLKTTDQAVLESVYDDYKDTFPVTPLMTVAEVKAVLDVVKSPKAKQMKPEEFFDNSIMQKIQASGFIEQVNKR